MAVTSRVSHRRFSLYDFINIQNVGTEQFYTLMKFLRSGPKPNTEVGQMAQ